MKEGQVSCGMKLKTITFLMKKKGSYCKHILGTKSDKIDQKNASEMKLRITGWGGNWVIALINILCCLLYRGLSRFIKVSNAIVISNTLSTSPLCC